MQESTDTTQTQPQAAEFDDSLPPGSHALEVAAHAGFGPLSPLAREAWHGQAAPCVSCGQLVHRDDPACEHCGQDLSEAMVRKMRQHAGPWFVLEHVRPFPGVSLERIVRQIRRGLITETSIVRGPSSDYQWRFAVETPGLCRYFNRCWCCHAPVTLSDTYCQHCLHYLSFEKPRAGLHVADQTQIEAPSSAPPAVQSVTRAPAAATAVASPVVNRPAAPPIDNRQSTIANPPAMALPASASPRSPESPDLARLSAAVRQSRITRAEAEWDQPPRIAGVNVSWIAAVFIIAVVIALVLISRARTDRPASQVSPSLPTMTAPAPSTTPAPHAPPPPSTQTTASPSTQSPPPSAPSPPQNAPSQP